MGQPVIGWGGGGKENGPSTASAAATKPARAETGPSPALIAKKVQVLVAVMIGGHIDPRSRRPLSITDNRLEPPALRDNSVLIFEGGYTSSVGPLVASYEDRIQVSVSRLGFGRAEEIGPYDNFVCATSRPGEDSEIRVSTSGYPNDPEAVGTPWSEVPSETRAQVLRELGFEVPEAAAVVASPAEPGQAEPAATLADADHQLTQRRGGAGQPTDATPPAEPTQ